MAKLFGAQRMVLQAIHDSPKNAAGFVSDLEVARSTQIAIADIRDWLETLEGEGYVEVARTTTGLRVSITAKGRQAVRQFQRFEGTPSEKVDSASPAGPMAPTEESDERTQPSVNSLKVALKATVAASARRPFGTGEPIRFEVHAALVNLCDTALFIVEARLRSVSGRHRLEFKTLCDGEHPLLSGARRSETLKIPNCINDRFVYNLLSNVCQADSIFEIATARGEHLTYQAIEVCDERFLGWPMEIIDQNTLDPSRTWFPDTSPSFEIMCTAASNLGFSASRLDPGRHREHQDAGLGQRRFVWQFLRKMPRRWIPYEDHPRYR